MTNQTRAIALTLLAAWVLGSGVASAQAPPPVENPSASYIIGPDDILSVLFWRDKDMSYEVVVRPDGKISLPLVNDVQAGGLTPSQLRDNVNALARRFVEEPSVTVMVKQINSRKLFITGQVEKPGAYSMSGATTVLQLISLAGGLKEFIDGKRILIMHAKDGKPTVRMFNYREVASGKHLEQNIELQPGDTVVVPQ
jgi:polysaccharide biosynthesis/export protein